MPPTCSISPAASRWSPARRAGSARVSPRCWPRTARRSRWWRGAPTGSSVQGRASRKPAAGRIAIEADVLDRAAMARAFDAAEKAFGTVTILVNNAGVAHADRARSTSPKRNGGACCRTNLDAVFFWAQEAARRMLAAEEAGRDRQHRLGARASAWRRASAAYAAAKAGVDPAHQGAGARTGRSRASASTRSRRAGSSPRSTDDFLTSEPGAAIKRDIPMGRFGKAGDLDGALLLLASDAGALHDRRDHRGRRRPGRARSEDRTATWISRSRPKSKTSACACAPSSSEHVLPLEADPANYDEHENIRLDRAGRRAGARRRAAGLWAPQIAEGIRRHGPADRRPGRRCTRRPTARSSARSRSTARRPTTAT